MWQWVFANAETLAALVTVAGALAPLAWYGLKWAMRRRQMFLSSKRADREQVSKLISAVEGVANDVKLMRSEQVSLKTRLETHAAMQWAILSGSKDPAFQTDADGNHWRANRAYVELVGRSPEEVRGRGWELTIHHEDRDRVLEEWRDAITGRRGFESEFRIVARNGRVLADVRCTAVPLFCDAQVLTGYFGQYEKLERAQ